MDGARTSAWSISAEVHSKTNISNWLEMKRFFGSLFKRASKKDWTGMVIFLEIRIEMFDHEGGIVVFRDHFETRKEPINLSSVRQLTVYEWCVTVIVDNLVIIAILERCSKWNSLQHHISAYHSSDTGENFFFLLFSSNGDTAAFWSKKQEEIDAATESCWFFPLPLIYSSAD